MGGFWYRPQEHLSSDHSDPFLIILLLGGSFATQAWFKRIKGSSDQGRSTKDFAMLPA